jgi:hypothetical protein
MRQKSGPDKQPAEDAIRDIRRATRRHFSAEEKIRVVLEGLRGEESIAELCRREGIASSMYYGWSKEFLEIFIAFDANLPLDFATRNLHHLRLGVESRKSVGTEAECGPPRRAPSGSGARSEGRA